MADVQAQPEAEAKVQEASIGADDVQAMIMKALEEDREKTKSEIAGLNRRNSELEKQIKERDDAVEAERKSKLTATERLQDEMKREKDEMSKLRRELQHERNEKKARTLMKEKGIPESLVKYIDLSDENTLSSSVEDFAEAWKGEMSKERQDVIRQVGAPGPAGSAHDSAEIITREQYDAMNPADKLKMRDDLKSGAKKIID